MKHVVEKNRLQHAIDEIEKELEQLNVELAEPTLSPSPRSDETFFIRTREDKKEKLLAKLSKYTERLQACEEAIEKESAKHMRELDERVKTHDGIKAERQGGLR